MIPLLVILEILVLCLSAIVFLYHPQMGVSEAICTGIIVTLLTLSFVYQTVFFIGEPKLAFLIEVTLVIASLILLKRRSNYLKLIVTTIFNFWQQQNILAILVGIPLTYLALQAIFLPPTGPDYYDYHLPKVLFFQQEKSLYLENITTLRQAIFPIGWDILNHAFLRFYTDYGLGIFAFLIYLSIGCGVYSLARQITSKSISIVATLAVITMPQIVLQSTSLNTDLPLAGVAVLCFLLLFRLYRNLNIIDLILITLASAFGLSIKLTFLLFLAPFTLFSGYLLLTKYSIKRVMELLMVNYKWVLLTIFPVFILSQVWLYIHNHSYYGGWSGPPDYIDHFQQKDGLKGMGSNLVRYIFESIDLMPPTNLLSDALFNVKISNQLDKIYDRLVKPLIGNAGFLKNYLDTSSPYQFKIIWRYVEGNAWYGWLGFFLAIPSLIYALIKGKCLTRVVSIILICFFLLVCYKVAWSPWRGRYFALLFASSGICIANALNDLHLYFKKTSITISKIIITISMITMIITMLANEDKAMLDLRRVDANNIFSRETVDLIADQNIWTQTNFGQKRMRKTIRKELEPQISLNPQIALLGNYYVNIYDYLMALPEVDFIPIHTSSYPNLEYRFDGLHNEFTAYPFPNPLKTNLDSFDYLLCLDAKCNEASNELLSIPHQLIWHFIPSEAQARKLIIPEAQLFKLR